MVNYFDKVDIIVHHHEGNKQTPPQWLFKNLEAYYSQKSKSKSGASVEQAEATTPTQNGFTAVVIARGEIFTWPRLHSGLGDGWRAKFEPLNADGAI